MITHWEKGKTNYPNQSYLVIDGQRVGFICKPKSVEIDGKIMRITNKGIWAVFRGFGENAEFRCCAETKAKAVACLESWFGGNTNTDQFSVHNPSRQPNQFRAFGSQDGVNIEDY